MSIGTRLKERLSTPLYRFQVQGVRFVEQAGGRALIADDMGLGKTIQAIGFLALHPEARPAICVVPATGKWVWQRELRQHAKLRCEILEGRTPYRPRRKVWIINWEILAYWVDYLIRLRPSVLVMDECHYLANRGAKRTKACARLARACKYRLALSGTPITNAPVEFFPVLQMLRPRQFNSFQEYAWAYCDPQPGFRGHMDYRGSSNERKLNKRISHFTIRRLKGAVLKDLPKKQRVIIPVDISNRRDYESARDDFHEWLVETRGAGAALRASGAESLVRLGALKRLAGAGKVSPATQWIQDFLAETDQKLVVFAYHRPVLEALQAKFPRAAVLTGRTHPRDRQRAVDHFQHSAKCRLFLGQIKAAGVLITLTAASTTLTLELGWNEAVHNQAEDRILRIGQKARKCTNYYMIGQGTIEEWLVEIIQNKQDNINKVLGDAATGSSRSLLKILERVI